IHSHFIQQSSRALTSTASRLHHQAEKGIAAVGCLLPIAVGTECSPAPWLSAVHAQAWSHPAWKHRQWVTHHHSPHRALKHSSPSKVPPWVGPRPSKSRRLPDQCRCQVLPKHVTSVWPREAQVHQSFRL